ncbi:hypothetical protein ABIB82_004210 [Bradyrhizobium sp. i1.8.4]|uniref:hypothetical protein n=1 Tax=unclassified Bradyrhizobium TaxID=2631580 RepID=UPI003D1A6FC8
MTIASCYLSPEGVVLGADSTSTYFTASGPHYFNHGQKLFEIGVDSTLGIVTWGLGGLAVSSHRMLVAALADDLRKKKAASVAEVATRWCQQFWKAYSNAMSNDIAQCEALSKLHPYDPLSVPPKSNSRTKDQETQFIRLRNMLRVGFCLGGHVLPDRTPHAFQTLFDALDGQPPTPTEIPMGKHRFWGVPNMSARLLNGYDDNLRKAILSSGKWVGTEADLDNVLKKQSLTHPPAPMRDAVDFTYSCILSTIKALKFSEYAQTCGGPIEIAVITVDRPFRWVRHKEWDAAITEGDP